MARIGYTGGLSRQPVKMGTGALNFMAGVAQVQQMTQAQEAHEQNLQKNEQAMRLADAHEERLQRQDARQEQEASRNQIAFDSQLTLGRQRARTWNGRDKPAWASSGLNQRYSDLNDLAKRIQQGRQRGDDMSADVLAFSQLANEYDTLYKQESTQRNLTNNISELEGLYEMTGLQPDPEVAGFIESVQSNVGGVGYTSMEATPEQQRALATELGRARAFAQEYEVRQGIKSDIDSMREMLNMMRAGRMPEGFTIDQSVIEEIAQLRVGGEDDDGKMSPTTLSELVKLLDPSAQAALNPWDPEQDVSKLQDQVRQATGLFEILATKEGKNQHDLLLNVRTRMEKERRQFSQRNQVAQMVQTMRQQQPDGPMSPIERWASRHIENAGSGRFDLTYDDDPEYVRMWKAISDKAALLGGDTQMAIVAMNQAWREAAPVRKKWDDMERRPGGDGQRRDYDADYYSSYVEDVLASEQQLEEAYASADPRIDEVVNYTPEKTPAEFFKANDSLAPLYLTAEEEANSRNIKDSQIRMLSDTVHDPGWVWDDEKAAEEKKAYYADKRLSIALKQAGISRAEFFGYEFKRTGSAEQDLWVNDRAKYMEEYPEYRMFEASRTTFAEFARAEPEKASRLMHAMQNPSYEWQQAWENRETMGFRSGMRTNMIGWGARTPKKAKFKERRYVEPNLPERAIGPDGLGSMPTRDSMVMPSGSDPGEPRADMVFPEIQRDVPPQSAGPETPPVSMEEAMGEAPATMEEQYSDAMSGDVARRQLSGDIPEDQMLTAPSGAVDGDLPSDPALPAMPRRVEAFELADLGGDYGPGERVDAQSVYESSSRTKVSRVSEDPVYATADKHAKTKRLPEVEQMLEQLLERRRKSGDGKLTRKDAAMLAALIERRKKLLNAKQRRR